MYAEESGLNPRLFSNIATDWLETVKPMWKANTYNGEKKRVEKDLIKPFGNMLITDITPRHIRESFKKLADEGMLATLKKVAENAVRIFDFAIALELCENNPCVFNPEGSAVQLRLPCGWGMAGNQLEERRMAYSGYP